MEIYLLCHLEKSLFSITEQAYNPPEPTQAPAPAGGMMGVSCISQF